MKRLLLVFGFVAVATMSYAGIWTRECGEGGSITIDLNDSGLTIDEQYEVAQALWEYYCQ